MTFNIPVSKIEKLESLINRANKKGGHITYVRGQEVICDGLLTLNVNKVHQHTSETHSIKVRCVEVEVDGCYKINGWSFVGTIEFTPNGNIIRLADSSYEGKVPAKYLHTPRICEHCGTIRNRKDTYLIVNDKGEFKQVGSSCLLEYTCGLDAVECASIMSCLNKVIELCDYTYTDDEFRSNGFSSVGAGLDSKEVKGYATALVKNFGYKKADSDQSTVNDLIDVLFYHHEERLSDIEPDYSLIDEITEYAQSITDEYGYMANAKLAWLNPCIECRDFGLVASFISVYLREKEKLEQNKRNIISKHVGNVGDRITIRVASSKVLSSRETYYTYYGEVTYLLEIKDSEGNVYIWSTGTCVIKEGDVITATVKEHSEFRNIKQTVITRGRVKEAE